MTLTRLQETVLDNHDTIGVDGTEEFLIWRTLGTGVDAGGTGKYVFVDGVDQV